MLTESQPSAPITVGGVTIPPGRKIQFELPFARAITGATQALPVKVINGRSSGPHIWLSAAIHGDELNGIQIIRTVLSDLDAKSLRGAVIAVPIVNPLGFVIESRYLPDRRDLNRSFPGSVRGSTASRLAHLFMNEIVDQCTVGIDLHTATNHRYNLPQIRADLDDPDTASLAQAFRAPFSIHAKLRDGSLRQAATERGKVALLYEAGQAHRFDEDAVTTGINGVRRILRHLGMIEARMPRAPATKFVRRTRWVRARRGGIAELNVRLGDYVEEGDQIASLSDAFGVRPTAVRTPLSGWVIARSLRPLVNSGDALVHVAAESGPDQDEPAERGR